GWEETLGRNGVVIDRPKGCPHPRYPAWIYPVDYGYVPGTTGGDGHEVDVFVGSAAAGLVGLLITCDAEKDDRETKLLWNLTEYEIAAVTAFLFGGAMTGYLVRRPATDDSVDSRESA
ncbi:MAG: inorganic pyrophosphatase, partial [Thermomicrobiales bacterium]|nr:inorganic pyrophosphatase [Thermomicrobiales bacterium]